MWSPKERGTTADPSLLHPCLTPLPPSSPPPSTHPDPSRQGMGYWRYTINELGIYDMAAQVDKLHEVKTQVGGVLGGGRTPTAHSARGGCTPT